MGYTGILLRINLTDSSIKKEVMLRDIQKAYIGGSGFCIKYLYDEVPPETDPLSPQNKLIIATGPLTGTAMESSGRAVLAAKSPLTGLFGDSHSGSEWGPALKSAGYDMIIIEGKAKKPVYIFISDDLVQILPAKKIWKNNVVDTLGSIWQTHGRVKDPIEGKGYTRVISIGLPGINLSPISCIMADKHRAFGRCGYGAVMGSKNLKAIAVQGTGKINNHDKTKFDEVNQVVKKRLETAPVTGEALKVHGTPVLVSIINESGILPVNNFSSTQIEGVESLFTDVLKECDGWKEFGCSDYCNVMKCGKYVNTDKGQQVVPEYESIFALGTNCGITDFQTIVEANRKCNDYGIDTISTGNVLSYAMEYSEKVKPLKLKSGELKFGNKEAFLEAIDLMGLNKKLGSQLNLGVKQLSNIFNYQDGVILIKGMGFPAYDPRGVRGQALSYATSTRGADHLKGYMIAPEILGTTLGKLDPLSEEGKAENVMIIQNASAVLDAFLVCKFIALGMVEEGLQLQDLADIINADTGFNYTVADLLKIGDRIYNLERLYNLKTGMDGSADVLPKRFQDPIPDGPHKGLKTDITKMLKEYYEKRGWDQKGIPTADKLNELGLT